MGGGRGWHWFDPWIPATQVWTGLRWCPPHSGLRGFSLLVFCALVHANPSYYDECVALAAKLQLAKAAVQEQAASTNQASVLLPQLKEELATTKRNYEEQVRLTRVRFTSFVVLIVAPVHSLTHCPPLAWLLAPSAPPSCFPPPAIAPLAARSRS